ncbi:MAG: hypothetical protein M1343_03015 [Chloroflexi bacterium]|nr:hypothetical protein [Chloroflexota bacterium]MDA8187148.1 hypothetical protein [Dehalococcoidales bacterium]
MWYFARVQLLPGMEKQLRQDLLWGESHLPKNMVGMVPAEGEVGYVFGHCNSTTSISDSGELEDLRRYFKVLEFGPAQPFFIGEHAPNAFNAHLQKGELFPRPLRSSDLG